MSGSGASRLGWYAHRAARMSPAEMVWRARDQMVRMAWSGRQVTREQLARTALTVPAGHLRFTAVLPPGTAARVPGEARKPVLVAADRLMCGEWETLGVTRTDLDRPDWFRDPVSGRRSDPDQYAFRVEYRNEEQTGNVKQVWEIARLQHLTLLATAWALTRDDRYAWRVDEQLRSFWQENPFLSGINWTNGIEVGIRLISLAWIRRLLDGWPGVTDLFEGNGVALRQIEWHQQYLATFRSRGSSANNHVVAEAAGQLVASCAFPWFPRSDRWRLAAARLLEHELLHNTFPSGINRELASDYHPFVAELGFLAAVEAEVSGHPLSPEVWRRLAAMADSAAALLDERMRPPRQGDSDEGRALLLDPPAASTWPPLLALAGALIGPLDWWPRPPAEAASTLVGALLPAGRQIEGLARAPPVAVPRCRDHPAARPGRRRRARDLVPLRRRPARVPQYRRARSRGRLVSGGQVRGRGHPRRPGYLLLPRRTRVAVVLPLDPRAQHRRARRPELLRRGRLIPVGPARGCPRSRGHR